MNLDNLTVVLVEPRGERNIGSVARAMANFGMTDLRLVAPKVDHLHDEARKMAVKASVLLEQATLYPDLQTALGDCHYAYATTRRFGKYRVDFLHPDDAAEQLLPLLDSGRVALVFGREDKGLPNEILDRCHEAVCIPTSPGHPSLNLGQAAMVVLYEVRRAVRRSFDLDERDLSGKLRDQAPPATAAELEEFFGVWDQAMSGLGMFRGVQPTTKMRSYRRILKRSDPDRRELRLMEATAWRIVHFATRIEARIRDQIAKEARKAGSSGPGRSGKPGKSTPEK